MLSKLMHWVSDFVEFNFWMNLVICDRYILLVMSIYEIKIEVSFSKCFMIYLLDMLKCHKLLIGLTIQAIAPTLE